MMKNAKEKWVEYTLYVILFAALVMCLYFIFISSSLSQRILACSLIITIIIGGFINVWKIFHSSDKLDDVSNNLKSISTKLADLSNTFDDLIDLKKKDSAQTRDLEEQKRKEGERHITEPLKEEFEKFLLYWKKSKESIFEDVPYERKLPWMEIESIGKALKNLIARNKNVLREIIENEAMGIADDIIALSELIRAIKSLRFSGEYGAKQKEQVFNEGDAIIKKIEAFVEKI